MAAEQGPAAPPHLERSPEHGDAERHEEERASEREAINARVVHRALLKEGEGEIERSWHALGFSGLAAGASMGLSLVLQGGLEHYVPDVSWERLITSLGYPAGFIAVTLGRQQLYTETTLTAFLPFLHHRRADVLVNVLRLWTIVLIANVLGAFLFAWAAASTTAFSPDLQGTFAEIGVRELSHGFSGAFVKGIFGGWMIALMVWLMPSAEVSRIWVIGLITYILALSELTHIIAGSLDGLFAVVEGHASMATFAWDFFIPVLAGNTIGGIVFVAALNHAQVAAE
jgi:formate/nitrite transporter FocA (FNT family)